MSDKQGDSTCRLADGTVSQQTIRNWLDRFEDQPLEEAPFDNLGREGQANSQSERMSSGT